MHTNFRRILTAGLAFAVVAAGDVVAQEQTERERQQQEQEAERMRQAEHRVQEAQRQLEQAVQLLQEQESRQAREQMRQAMNELQSAMAELDRSRLTTLYGEFARVGPLAISISSSGPMMGVYLNTERDPVTDSIGAVLDNVVEDGPAAEAGLKDGDIITMANGNSLARTSRRDTSPSNKLVGIKDELEVGDTLHVEYRRGSRSGTADIVLVERDTELSYGVSVGPDVSVFPRAYVSTSPRAVSGNVATLFRSGMWSIGWLEVELIELDEDLGAYFGTSEGLLIIRAPEDEVASGSDNSVI
jgi:C-terminal processing protease CtpA/Prc